MSQKKKLGRPSAVAMVPKSLVDKLFVKLVEYFDDSQTLTANALNCSQSHIWGYLTKSNKETVSPIIALRAEVETNGAIKCEDLCPELGELISAINERRLRAGKPGIGENASEL